VDVISYLRQGADRIIYVGNRGPLYNGGNTRSSPHPSMVALGCLNERGEEEGGQGCY